MLKESVCALDFFTQFANQYNHNRTLISELFTTTVQVEFNEVLSVRALLVVYH